MNHLRVFLLSYPAVLPLAFFLTWACGRLVLGHWPRPMLDDPKSLGAFVSFLHLATTLVLCLGLPLYLMGVLGAAVKAVRDQAGRGAWVRILTFSLGCFLLAMLFLKADPFRFVEWCAD